MPTPPKFVITEHAFERYIERHPEIVARRTAEHQMLLALCASVAYDEKPRPKITTFDEWWFNTIVPGLNGSRFTLKALRNTARQAWYAAQEKPE